VIRVNSQSGKGGIAYLLEAEYGLELPRRLQIEFSQVVQAVMDTEGKELVARDLWQLFEREYGLASAAPAHVRTTEQTDGQVRVAADLDWGGRVMPVQGQGNGPIDAFVTALNAATGRQVRVLDYHEHAIGAGAQAQAMAYMELRVDEQHTVFGVGRDTNIVSASFKAIVSGLRRAAPRAQSASIEHAAS
jgi:2-isopropylmalate synthase